ncbi:glycosyltransferase [Candidatus Daviesbacteria bacterium]|nr:glycosyltransferase [Candidatus Daviesbacteria bacterium]
MPAKLSVQQKIKLVQRALSGENITKLCRETGISRTLLYRFIKLYKEEKLLKSQEPKAEEIQLVLDLIKSKPNSTISQIISTLPKNEKNRTILSQTQVKKILKKLRLDSLRKRRRLAYGTQIKLPLVESSESLLEIKQKQLRPQDRLEMIERVRLGESVIRVCKLYGVSRTIFYRYKARYDQAPDGQKLESLWDKKPEVSHYYNQSSEEVEQSVLAAVREYPELSSHKLVWVLPQIGGRPILSNHGVQNVLRRHQLSSYEQRLVFSQAYHKPTFASKFFGAFQFILNLVGSFEPGKRKVAVRGSFIFLGTIFLIVTIWGATAFFKLLIGAPSLAFSIGIIFSLIALTFGLFFFLYSLKYYITIAMILSFSRQGAESAVSRNNFFANLIRGSKETPESGYSGVFGLQADLSGVNLDRKPFVSIHLATYNEKRVLDRLLTAATSQEYENYEVVLTDDSTDETLEILEKWKDHPRIKIVHRDSRSGYKGGALNEGLKVADPKTEFIIIFDADFIPYPDTIIQFLKYFKLTAGGIDQTSINSTKIAAIQGYQWHVLNKSENWVTRGVRTEYSGSYVIERAAIELYSGLKQIAGSVYMIRKDVLSNIGWGTSITEDFELTLKLYEQGYKVVYTPYIQAPAEAVSTIKRLIRQRMRWAEGHSFNVKKMFKRLLLTDNMTRAEKFEFVYLAPYYLQSLFFIIGTLSWFLAEVVFKANLPFWTATWGWSLVLTNLFALPLMNLVGLFLEESDQKDYFGLASFVATSYIVAPFQGYAALKGFLEKEEGPWFRTPKTGKITDVFTPGKFYNLVFGWFGGARAKTTSPTGSALSNLATSFSIKGYLSLGTANNRFDNFKISRKKAAWLGNLALVLFLCLTVLLASFAPFIPFSQTAEANQNKLVTVDDIKKAPQRKSISSTPKVTQNYIEDSKSDADFEDITTPRIIQKTTRDGSRVEFIFHKEPRTRIKVYLKGKDVPSEVETETLKIADQIVSPKRARIFKDREVLYEDALPNIDIRYRMTNDLLVEEFVLKNKQALEYFKPDQNTVEQSLKIIDAKVISPDRPDTFGIFTEDGQEIFKYAAPFAQDAKQVKNNDLSITMEKQQLGYKLTKHINRKALEWLKESKREFPIVIDPTVIVSGGITEGETSYGSMQRKVVAVSSSTGTVGHIAGASFESDRTIGYVSWTNPSNAISSNNTYATAVVTTAGQYTSGYLKVTNFDFSTIPSTAVIDGIEVNVERKAAAAGLQENSIRLYKAGRLVGDDKSTNAAIPTTEATITYGGNKQLWGVSLSRSDVTNANFGIGFSYRDTSGTKGTNTASVDYISMKIYYTDLSGTINWYAFYADGQSVSYKKSTNGGSSWAAAVDIDSADADNNNISVSYNASSIVAVWQDSTTTTGIEGKIIDLAASDALGTKCTIVASSLGTTYMPSVVAVDGRTAVMAYSDTSTGTSVGVNYVTGLDGTCTSTAVTTSLITFGNGLTASDRPVVINIDGASRVGMVFQDGDLSYSELNARTVDWTTNNLTIASVTDNVYSVTTDGTTVWVLSVSGTTSTNFYKCCTTDFTETSIDSDTGAIGYDGLSDIDMYCVSATDCKFVYTDDLDTTAPKLIFRDCDDATCSTGTTTTLDSDIGDSSDAANPSIWCVSSTDCKVVYGDDMETATPLLKMIDCSNSACSTTDATSTLDNDLGGAADTSHSDVDCTGGSTDCRVLYNDPVTNDVTFLDCNDGSCSVPNATTDVDGNAGAARVFVSMDCNLGVTDCKLVWHTQASSDLIFRDCGNAGCSTGTSTTLDASVGGVDNSVAMSIKCFASSDCKIVYNDPSTSDVFFIDCSTSTTTCSATDSVTTIDSTAGDIDDGPNSAKQDVNNYPSVSMYCSSATDCKLTYISDINDYGLNFVDCDNAGCSSGSVQAMPGPRFKGAVYCPSSTDCKFAYYDTDSAGVPTVQFADVTTTNAFPSVTSLTAPFTSQTNLTQVSLTYDSQNTRIYAHGIMDTSEQAYFIDSAASSISWGSTYSYKFTAGDLGNISGPLSGYGTSQIGVVLRQGSNFEFGTLPEKTLVLVLLVPFLPGLLKKLRESKRL